MSDELDPEFLKTICGMAEQIQAINKEAVAFIKSEVDSVIHRRITDNRQIEMLLERLLDCAGMSDEGLALFKRLCRYYYPINPSMTAEYIHIYRDLYDSNPENESEDGN